MDIQLSQVTSEVSEVCHKFMAPASLTASAASAFAHAAQKTYAKRIFPLAM